MQLVTDEGSHLTHRLEEEYPCTLLLLLHGSCRELTLGTARGLDSQSGQIHRREREVPTPDRGLGPTDILEDARTAAHRSDLMQVTLRVIGAPELMLVEGRIEEDKVREESVRRRLTRQEQEVEVRRLEGVLPRQRPSEVCLCLRIVCLGVVHALLDLEDLDGEDRHLALA